MLDSHLCFFLGANTGTSPKEEVRNIASKGGQASHSGGFASMDPDKQVSHITHRGCESSEY